MSKKRLMENEMDQAEAVLAAKSVTDTLQDMAEKIAKLEANNIMPLLDTIRLNFGPEYSDQLSADATTVLQAVLASLKTAKDQIGANIDKMQGVITGEAPSNDMAMNVGVPGDPPDAPMAPDANTPDQVAPEAPEVPAAPETQVTASDVDDVFSDAPPASRARKESLQSRAQNILRESANPDGILMSETLRLRKTLGLHEAIAEVADRFGVDAEDIVAIIREHVASKKK